MAIITYSNRTRYWQRYVFSNPPIGYHYTRGLDIPFHLLNTKKQYLLNTKIFAPLKKTDLFHTYNSIVANNKPWVVEVESLIPRYGNLDEKSKIFQFGINKLRNKYCKKIIFTSEYSVQMNKKRLINFGINPEKFTVVYRAVERYKNMANKESTFNILFAGNGFYRKGGMELLDAFSQINNSNLRLTIISSFEIDWEVIPTEEQITKYNKIINTDKRITVFPGLPHHEVIKNMQKSHLFIATTHADPFNNTILEAMACKVPIITSDIRSIPEFVKHKQNGFLIKIKENSQEQTINEIKKHIEKLYNNNELRNQFAEESLRISKEIFDINIRNKALKKIYDIALNK